VLLVAGRAGLAAAEAALGALPPARRARHALGLATREALFAPPAALLSGGTPLCGHALHTSHAFCPAKLVRDVHGRGAAVHVAITPEWPVPGLDADEGRLDRGSLFELLERGVDGVVSDRPREVRRALDDWIAKND
jgi:hypothetical protein